MDLFNAQLSQAINEAVDLSQSATRVTLAKQIRSDIDEYCANAYDGGHRKHLGASQIGHVCKRHLFYIFRWAKLDTYTDSAGVSSKGRMMRLFNRGHREEERFVEWLRGVGFQVHDKDSSGNQLRMSGVNGHFGGSLDGVALAPKRYGLDDHLLCEFKTNGTGPKFEKLCLNGVQKEKEMHFAQMSTYGYKYQLYYAIYLNINKNDDDIHAEIVQLDWQLGAQMEQKAYDIVMSNKPPAKFSLSPAVMECRICTFKDICHGDELPAKSCRSCVHARPIENGQWQCGHYGAIIPDEFIPKGCDNWRALK